MGSTNWSPLDYAPVHDIVAKVSEIFDVDESISLGIISAFVFFLLVTLVLSLKRTFSTKKNTVALVGLSGAGKTRIFSELVGVGDIATYTSMVVNVQEGATIGKKEVVLVDVPGAENIRETSLEPHKPSISHLVFLIDSATFSKNSKDVAEYLYDLLADDSLRGVPVLIACNKQDEALAKSCSVIKTTLQKEFNLLNTTRAASLDSITAETRKVLGNRGDEFVFGKNLGRLVEFVHCSAATGDISTVKKWFI